jgi:DNA-directed RNA polymerase subunit F
LPDDKTRRTVVSVAEAKEILVKLDPERADQIQKRTMDFVTKFAKLTPAQAKTARRRIVTEGNLTEEEAAELVNVMPKTLEELRTFTSGWKKLVPTEAAEKILAILASAGSA